MKTIWASSRPLEFKQRLQSVDWSFVRGSALVSMGMFAARILGLGFSLILASVLSPDGFGQMQYALAVASVLAIVVHPFGQHVLARFISSESNISTAGNAITNTQSKTSEPKLESILGNCWVLWVILLGFTLVITMAVIVASDDLGYELLAVVVGIAIFYAYWGVSRGYMRSDLLTAAYLGSNVVQLIVVIAVIWYAAIHSSAAALFIYGLSYVPVIWWLQKGYPLALFLRRGLALFDWGEQRRIARFALPIALSHAAFMLFVAADILFLNRSLDADVVGRYALAKTLAGAFSFVPMGIATLLMPKVAQQAGDRNDMLMWRSIGASLGVNLIFLAIFWFLVEWFVTFFFGTEYLVQTSLYLTLAFSAMMLGIQSIAAAAYVGNNRPGIETVARWVAATCAIGGCWILIPFFQEWGAAASILSGSIAALLIYLYAGIYSTRKPAIDVVA